MGHGCAYTPGCVFGVLITHEDASRLIQRHIEEGTNERLLEVHKDWGDDYVASYYAIVSMLEAIFYSRSKPHLHYGVTAFASRAESNWAMAGVPAESLGYIVGMPFRSIDPQQLLQMQETHGSRIVELLGKHVTRPSVAFHLGIVGFT